MNAKTSTANKCETGFIPGLCLFLYALLALFAGWIPVLTKSALVITRFPVSLALLCGYCALVVLLTSLVDRCDRDAAVGAFHLIGRGFMWGGALLAAFSFSLLVTRTLYADDLLNVGTLSAVGAVTSVLFSFFAYLLLRQHNAGMSSPRTTNDPRTNGLKTALAVLLCIIASLLLYQRYTEKQSRDANYARAEEEQRRSAKPWRIEFEALRGGMTVQEVSTRARQDGHFAKCYGDLRSEERSRPGDTNICWIVIGQAWGIPALSSTFGFTDDGLRSNFVRFPDTAWDQVQSKLDQIGQRLPQSFGIEPLTGGPILGWRLDSGLVFAAAAPKGKEITVLWTAKRDVANDHCPYQGAAAKRNPEGYTVPIKQLWPEIDCTKPR